MLLIAWIPVLAECGCAEVFPHFEGALSIYYLGYSLHGIHLNAANSNGDFDRAVQKHKGSFPPGTPFRDFALIRWIQKNTWLYSSSTTSDFQQTTNGSK